MRIGWFIDRAGTYSIASVRYRAAYPALGLSDLGHDNLIFRDAAALRAELSALDALVIVKRLDVEAMQLALLADERGVAILLDLCDDVLMHGYRAQRPAINRMVFAALVEVADGLVAPTRPLLDRLMRHVGVALRGTVVPDAIETPALVERAALAFERSLGGRDGSKSRGGAGLSARGLAGRGLALGARAARAYRRLRSRSAAEILRYARRRGVALMERAERRFAGGLRPAVTGAGPPAGESSALRAAMPEDRKRVVWFGNHGAPYSDAGVMTLMRAVPALSAVDRDIPLCLVIVSDGETKAEILAAHLPFPVRHVAWSGERTDHVLAEASVFLMTRGNDDFSTFKSPNRALKALYAGVPVVADHVPGFGVLDDLIRSGDLERDLRAVLAAPPEPGWQETSLSGLDAMQLPAIAAQWAALIGEAVLRRRAKQSGHGLANRKIAVLVDLVQDVEIALPLVREILAAGLDPVVVATARALRQSQRLFSRLVALNVIPTVMDKVSAVDPDLRWLRGAPVLVTVAETSAGAHRVAHALTRNANAAGVLTATLQHGVENVGLTFEDPAVGTNVTILSDRIYLWGRVEDLPSFVPPDMRARASAVGRVTPEGSGVPLPVPEGSRIVGVFENLHWERYSAAFRERVVADLFFVAASRPDLLFVVRPHPAGLWTTRRLAGLTPRPANLVFADPADPAWAPVTAFDLVKASVLVVTTPSTIALDAAQAGVPVAILHDGVDPLPAYAPLPLIATAAGWLETIEAAVSGTASEHAAAARAFAARHATGTGAETRIVAELAAHIAAIDHRR